MKFKSVKPRANWYKGEWIAEEGLWLLRVVEDKYGVITWNVSHRSKGYHFDKKKHTPHRVKTVAIAMKRALGCYRNVLRAFKHAPPPPFYGRYYANLLERVDGDIGSRRPHEPNGVITNRVLFPIQPRHLLDDAPLFNAFGNTETEVSAGWLLQLTRSRGGWLPFTIEDVEIIYRRKFPKEKFHFNMLVEATETFDDRTGYHSVGGGWIYYDEESKYYWFTKDFVMRCFMSICGTKDLAVIKAYEELFARPNDADISDVGCIPMHFDRGKQRTGFATVLGKLPEGPINSAATWREYFRQTEAWTKALVDEEVRECYVPNHEIIINKYRYEFEDHQ